MIYICPACNLSGSWVELIVRHDIAEESGHMGHKSFIKMFHICKQPYTKTHKEEFAYATKKGVFTKSVIMVEMLQRV